MLAIAFALPSPAQVLLVRKHPRARLHGGELHAGPTKNDFTIEARLPSN